MKLYSWNVFVRNPDIDRVVAHISQLDFDVLCLQEVPGHVLGQLRALGYNIVTATDAHFVHPEEFAHLVILTPHTIRANSRYAVPEFPRRIRSRLFMACMRLWGWRYPGSREGLWADIALPGGEVRVFDLHLGLLYPESRRREFEAAMRLRDPAKPTIVCGDFNSIDTWRVTLLNWLQGGRLSDVLLKRREREVFEKHIAELHLANPLRGKSTQTISRSQLDHILVPDDWVIEKAEVVPERYGSDHHLVHLEARARS